MCIQCYLAGQAPCAIEEVDDAFRVSDFRGRRTNAVARATARLLGAPAGPSGPAASGHGKKTGNGGDGERVRYLTREDGRVLESGDAFVSRRSPGPVERICPGSQGPGLEAGCEEGASCEKRVARRAVPRAGRRARPSRERERRRSITVPDQTSQNEDVLFRTPRRRTNITVVS